jgi:tetratricopeptide (TPR) repeat protein
MSGSRRTAITAGILLVACLAGSALLLHHLDRIRSRATLEDVLYVSSPKVLKRLSLGYDGLLADVYWTRAVQYFGNRHHVGAADYNLLAPLLEITTTLDPHLTVAYEFGASFLAPPPPNGAGMPERAIKLVEYGIHNNPDDWKLYYELGFIHYGELKDYAKAADAFARGARLPNANAFLKVLAGRMAEHAGDIATARMMWTTAYQTSQDSSIRANAAAHLRAIQVDEDVAVLENLMASYHGKTGHFPASFAELRQAGVLRGTPLDPLGTPYKLVANGKIEVHDPDKFPFIEKGTPPGYVPPKVNKFLPSDYD